MHDAPVGAYATARRVPWKYQSQHKPKVPYDEVVVAAKKDFTDRAQLNVRKVNP